MSHTEMLARLIGQVEGEGADLVVIRALIEEASDIGAARALERLGLHDHAAEADMAELRQLLRAWRDAKRTVRAAVIGWVTRAALALIVIGMAVKLGLFALVRE